MNTEPISHRLIIQGDPVAKGRPKFASRGKFVKAYTPEKTVNYENLVQLSFMAQCRSTVLEGSLGCRVHLYFKIPQSASKKKKELMDTGEIRPTKKPDIDNCIKSITDALNGMAFYDDSQIVEVYACKYYSLEPRAVVELYQL